MKITIQSPDFKTDQALIDLVTERIGKLSRFNDRILEASVVLKLDKSQRQENKVCEVRLSIPGNDLFAARQSKTFEEAAARTAEALRSQIEARRS